MTSALPTQTSEAAEVARSTARAAPHALPCFHFTDREEILKWGRATLTALDNLERKRGRTEGQ